MSNRNTENTDYNVDDSYSSSGSYSASVYTN